MNKNLLDPHQLMLYPTSKEGAREELRKPKNHKWLFLNMNPQLTEVMEEFLRFYYNSRREYIIIDGNEELDLFLGKDELDWRNFVQVTSLDGEGFNFQKMELNKRKGEKLIFSFLSAGMTPKEVDEHYQSFLDRVRKAKKEGRMS